jgi:hypothetical protein
MKINYNTSKIFFTSLVFSFLLIPALTFARQPYITTVQENTVTDPEISKAYYGQLKGSPKIYHIGSAVPFNLYLNVLVPDIEGQTKEVSMVVVKNKDEKNIFLQLKGVGYEWKRMFEPFGQNWYWQGPEYKAKVEAGQYDVYVWDPGNDSKFVFAVGEIESFGLFDSLRSIDTIVELKKNFFNESPTNFIFSPIGYGYIIFVYILALLAGLLYRFIFRKISRKVMKDAPATDPYIVKKNIGIIDRVVRAILGLGLLYLAITTTWGFLIIFLSGVCLFEAIFSWCLFYSAIGRNTCPVE